MSDSVTTDASKTLQSLCDVFSIFHDGSIVGFTENANLLTLEIDCSYLAKIADESFDRFYVELSGVRKLEFDPWMDPIYLEKKLLADYSDIFKAELEISNAEIKNDTVIVYCNQNDSSLNYCGGNLSIRCDGLKIYDQNKAELSLSRLDKICRLYWDGLTKTTENP